MGRKTKLTPELTNKIVGYLETGCHENVAFTLAGIHSSTFYRWLEKGEKGTGKYKEFRDAIKKAEFSREIKWVRDIESDPSWQSKAWLLERRHPERWAKRVPLVLGDGREMELTGVRIVDDIPREGQKTNK